MIQQIDIRLPRLMGADLREITRLRPRKLGYTLNRAPLSTASLTLGGEDARPTVGQFMELYDAQGSLGYFRVVRVSTACRGDAEITVELEHALCTLSDGVVFGYQEFGGTGVRLKTVLEKLLAMQPRRLWRLGTVDYGTEFQYSFENENLLTAILSLAEPLSDEYLWTFDFDTTPWTLNLITAPEGDASEMRLSRNIDSVTVETDRSELCTRIYPLGYGEGVNQLTIAGVNNNKKYLDADTVGAWGVVGSVYAETSVTDAGTLKAMAERELERRKNPRVTVTVSGLDLSALTGEPLDRFYVGRKCRVPLPDYGLWLDERVESIQKNDVFGDNAHAKVTLANKGADTVSELANISRKTSVGELYSQGATNQYAVHYADNADAGSALDCEFYIDPNAVWINSVMCKFKLESFRAYSTGAAAGGGKTSGGGGSVTVTSDSWSNNSVNSGTQATQDSEAIFEYTAFAQSHRHGLPQHYHQINASALRHSHNVTVGGHTHSLPAHTHGIEYGVYRGPTASGVTVEVDGNAVPASAIRDGEFDAVPYLSKDSAGRVTRGSWHRVTFTPDGLTRILADLHVKTFVRSVSGGNY